MEEAGSLSAATNGGSKALRTLVIYFLSGVEPLCRGDINAFRLRRGVPERGTCGSERAAEGKKTRRPGRPAWGWVAARCAALSSPHADARAALKRAAASSETAAAAAAGRNRREGRRIRARRGAALLMLSTKKPGMNALSEVPGTVPLLQLPPMLQNPLAFLVQVIFVILRSPRVAALVAATRNASHPRGLERRFRRGDPARAAQPCCGVVNNGGCNASAPKGVTLELSIAPAPPKPAIACTS
jgi:hypothetical protein